MSQPMQRHLLGAICIASLLLLGCPSGGGGSTPEGPHQDVASTDSTLDTQEVDTASSTDIATVDTNPEEDTNPSDTSEQLDIPAPEDTSVEDVESLLDVELSDVTEVASDTEEMEETSKDTVLPPNCPDATPNEPIEITEGKTVLTFTYNNQGTDSDRTVVVQAPTPLPDKALPVLFFFHGSGGGTNGTVSQCNKIQQAGLEIICIAPQGANQTESGKPGWNLGGGQTPEDDLTFVRTLWHAIKDDVHVDSSQIFAGGSSMGGAFTANVLSVDACTNFIAGHAHIASTLWTDTVINSEGQQAVVIIHGEKDGLIPIDGGPAFGGALNFLSVEDALALWATHNGCLKEKEPLVEEEETITRISYPSCSVPLVVYRLHDKGHNANVEDWYGANNLALLYEIFVAQTIP